MKFIKKHLAAVVAAVLVVVAVCLLFGDCVQSQTTVFGKTVEGDSYSGFKAIFGYSAEEKGISVEVLKFSFMNLLALILVVAGAVLAFIKLPFGNIISGACMLVGGVFFFLMGTFTVPGDGLEALGVSFALEPMVIVAGVLALLAGLVVLANPYVKKATKKKRK